MGILHRGRRDGGAGFTLIEATVALALTTLAVSAVLLGIGSAIQAATDGHERLIAAGLAQQRMDEILGMPHGEIDDYEEVEQPAAYWSAMEGWWREVSVGPLKEWHPAAPDDCWLIEVRVFREERQGGLRELARIRQVVAYVPR